MRLIELLKYFYIFNERIPGLAQKFLDSRIQAKNKFILNSIAQHMNNHRCI